MVPPADLKASVKYGEVQIEAASEVQLQVRESPSEKKDEQKMKTEQKEEDCNNTLLLS